MSLSDAADLELADLLIARVAARDKLTAEVDRTRREEWDLERIASVLAEGSAAALGIPVVRSAAVPWRTAYAKRTRGAEVAIVLGDEVRFEHDAWNGAASSYTRQPYHGPARVLDVAEHVRREVLLDVREQVHAGMAHVDPDAHRRRREDQLTRELFT